MDDDAAMDSSTEKKAMGSARADHFLGYCSRSRCIIINELGYITHCELNVDRIAEKRARIHLIAIVAPGESED
jgi:hypothetical protein